MTDPTPEERFEAVRREMTQKLIVPQLERFTAWLESRGIEPIVFEVGHGDQVAQSWTWSELMQEWYREMESFS